MSQVEKLHKALKEGPLTGWQIMHQLGIMNYKGRIHDLRKSGVNINTSMVTHNDTEIAEYSLAPSLPATVIDDNGQYCIA